MAKQVILDAELDFIQTALREGRASVQDVGMRAIGKPDRNFQARVIPIDMDHVRTLGAKRDSGATLDPIVIFRCRKTGAMKVGDGFHRHEEARVRGDKSIRAYVIEAYDLERETLFYCTMCNQRAYLKRTAEDVRKAAFMLFEAGEWIQKSNDVVAKHLGSTAHTVAKHRAAYCEEKGVPMPGVFVSETGKLRKRPSRMSSVCKDRDSNSYYATVANKRHNLGSDPDDAAEKLKAIRNTDRSAGVKRVSLDPEKVSIFLAKRGILATPISRPGLPKSSGGSVARSHLFVCEPGGTTDGFYRAVGRLVLLGASSNEPLALVLLCYPEDHAPSLRSLAERAGIMVTSPHVFANHLQGAAAVAV
jgi:hypothetical protein